MNQLEKYREELMACNEKILEGLLQRNAVVEELMAYKEENKMPMLQQENTGQKIIFLQYCADRLYGIRKIYDLGISSYPF